MRATPRTIGGPGRTPNATKSTIRATVKKYYDVRAEQPSEIGRCDVDENTVREKRNAAERDRPQAQGTRLVLEPDADDRIAADLQTRGAFPVE